MFSTYIAYGHIHVAHQGLQISRICGSKRIKAAASTVRSQLSSASERIGEAPAASSSSSMARSAMTTYRVCCFLRRFRAASNEPSEAIRDVFQAYTDGGGVVGEEALRRLLHEVQGETDAGAEAAAKEVMAFAAEQRLLKKGGLTAEGFHRWLCSDANAALDPRRGVNISDHIFFTETLYCSSLSL